jgi:prepilin-type processing-associated H-X9-DG protein
MSGTRWTLRNTGSRINEAVRENSGRQAGYESDDAGEDSFDSADKATSAGSPKFTVGGFSSSHKGGANFAMGDGRVRFLIDSVDMRVYQQLGNRADGALMSDDPE